MVMTLLNGLPNWGYFGGRGEMRVNIDLANWPGQMRMRLVIEHVAEELRPLLQERHCSWCGTTRHSACNCRSTHSASNR